MAAGEAKTGSVCPTPAQSKGPKEPPSLQLVEMGGNVKADCVHSYMQQYVLRAAAGF